MATFAACKVLNNNFSFKNIIKKSTILKLSYFVKRKKKAIMRLFHHQAIKTTQNIYF